jgi:hypothetical protein
VSASAAPSDRVVVGRWRLDPALLDLCVACHDHGVRLLLVDHFQTITLVPALATVRDDLLAFVASIDTFGGWDDRTIH